MSNHQYISEAHKNVWMMTTARVFSFPLFMSMSLWIWQHHSTIGAFLLIRERNSTLDVESMSWECNEFMSWKAGELLTVRTSPALGNVWPTEDLLMEKTSLPVSQQIHPSSKSFWPHVEEVVNLHWCRLFWVRQQGLAVLPDALIPITSTQNSSPSSRFLLFVLPKS